MLRKIYSIVALVCFSTFAFAQTGTLKGVISDVMTGEAIPFANVVIEKGGNQYAGTTTDFDGKYTILPVVIRLVYIWVSVVMFPSGIVQIDFPIANCIGCWLIRFTYPSIKRCCKVQYKIFLQNRVFV